MIALPYLVVVPASSPSQDTIISRTYSPKPTYALTSSNANHTSSSNGSSPSNFLYCAQKSGQVFSKWPTDSIPLHDWPGDVFKVSFHVAYSRTGNLLINPPVHSSPEALTFLVIWPACVPNAREDESRRAAQRAMYVYLTPPRPAIKLTIQLPADRSHYR